MEDLKTNNGQANDGRSTDSQAKDSRKLTKAEIERTELFNKTAADLLSKGYRRENITISSAKANIFGTLAGVVPVIPFLFAYFIINRALDTDIAMIWIYLSIPILIASIIIHELLHGTGWIIFMKGKFKSIAFGVVWQALMPYCTCKEPLRKGHYIVGLVLPFIILGIIPCIIACAIGSIALLLFGCMMIVCAGGDLLILVLILKTGLKGDVLFLDHPTDVGLAAFVKE